MKLTLTSTLIASGIALATLTGAAQAKGRLVVYCSATNEMCEAETKAFGCREEKPAGGRLVWRDAGPSVSGG